VVLLFEEAPEVEAFAVVILAVEVVVVVVVVRLLVTSSKGLGPGGSRPKRWAVMA
jgi:hypothetical protein